MTKKAWILENQMKKKPVGRPRMPHSDSDNDNDEDDRTEITFHAPRSLAREWHFLLAREGKTLNQGGTEALRLVIASRDAQR